MRSKILGFAAVLCALAVPSAAAAAPPFFKSSAPVLKKLRGGLPLAFARRPASDGSRGVVPAPQRAQVVVRFDAPPSARDLAALTRAGLTVERGRGADVPASGDADAVARAAALPGVNAVVLDGSPFRAPPPLDGTTAEVEAHD